MSQSLTLAIKALRHAAEHESPTMFWAEAMEHVSLLLKHIDRYGLSAGGMPAEITEPMLAWIVDQVFDGVHDDEKLIRNTYRLIAADHVAFSETEYAKNAPASLQSVLAERIRQIQVHCFYPEQDDELSDESLTLAAAAYALPRWFIENGINPWPWGAENWKPGERRTSLVKAGALILAEIDRIDRAAALAHKEQSHV